MRTLRFVTRAMRSGRARAYSFASPSTSSSVSSFLGRLIRIEICPFFEKVREISLEIFAGFLLAALLLKPWMRSRNESAVCVEICGEIVSFICLELLSFLSSVKRAVKSLGFLQSYFAKCSEIIC